VFCCSQQHRTLVAGLSHRYVRLFDLRDTSKCQQSIATKSVFGLSVDPFNEHRFCCFVENTLQVYDLRLRNIVKPVFSVNTPNNAPIVKVQWDPVRNNVLTCLTKDSTIIQQYHLIQPTSAAAEDAEYTHMDRHVGVSSSTLRTSVFGSKSWGGVNRTKPKVKGVKIPYPKICIILHAVTQFWGGNSTFSTKITVFYLKYLFSRLRREREVNKTPPTSVRAGSLPKNTFDSSSFFSFDMTVFRSRST
jgi:hypothetical protein